jgi:hypothetical protein
VDYFNPNDKTNLAPYRVLHFVALAYLAVRLMSKDWSGLQWRAFLPVIKCGQQSLAVFCVGIFGIVIMTCVAYYVSWSKTQDKVATSSLAPARARFRRRSANRAP